MTDLCSAISLGHGEPLTATASRVERWLLVEHRGAWGPESVPSGRMPKSAARALAGTANSALARLVLIRRPGRTAERSGRWVYAVDSRPGREAVLARHLETDAELNALTPPYGVGDAHGWTRLDGPLWLVCTHGRHDRCCALRGRPVARVLAARHPDRTWECTHVGGDRFAANVVALPEGYYLGRVEPEEVLRLTDDLLAGTLPAGRLRGRSSLPLPVQAAQQFAREATGRWGVADLALVQQDSLGDNRWRIALGGEPSVEVVVSYDARGDGDTRLLTCGDEQDKFSPIFALVSLTPAAA